MEAWVDDAVEELARMPHTCSLDVVDQHAEDLTDTQLGALLNVSRQAVQQTIARARVRLRIGLEVAGVSASDGR